MGGASWSQPKSSTAFYNEMHGLEEPAVVSAGVKYTSRVARFILQIQVGLRAERNKGGKSYQFEFDPDFVSNHGLLPTDRELIEIRSAFALFEQENISTGARSMDVIEPFQRVVAIKFSLRS